MTSPGRRIAVEGTVQGVGFRPWVWRLAREEGVAGSVRNDACGVVIEAFGSDVALEGFLGRLRREPPPAADIRRLAWEPIAPRELDGFEILASGASTTRRPSIPADLATCPACLAEVMDPANRRHRYPFTNCTDCGPRFTIATDIPYDRAATTMARFPMCPECAREYGDPADRRFHAQPNACPVCGPRLALLAADGSPLAAEEPLALAAQALAAGLIVAVKGLGGFHLACDATNEPAVERLRARKRRERKPFAVMVADLEAAEAVAALGDEERRLLSGTEHPIVLAPLRPDHGLAPSVAPGLDLVGVLLAYTPLHHLLLRAAGVPLVMTSGNLAEEPLAYRDEEAVARLGGIADLLLVHDREVAAPCEDSVARVVDGAPLLVRRSRGWVPRPLALARPVGEAVLAVGGDLKSVACIAAGDAAWLTPHVGDLASPESLDELAAAVDRLQRFLGVTPRVVAHDPHPGYHSRRWALSLPGVRHVAVQHHHAHVASCLAEHGLAGPALGVALDGTGWGPDGAAWGGELLLVEPGRSRRLATLRPLPLAGGETALREVWRLALAMLDDAFDGAPPLAALPLFARLDPYRTATVRRMLGTATGDGTNGGHRLNSPLAHGAGRWFDAVGALVLGLPAAGFEGEAALRLERAAAAAGSAPAYPFELRADGAVRELDLRPMVRALVFELLDGRPAPWLAARFHATLGAAMAAAVRAAAREHGALPVALSGGCLQNPLLARALREGLSGFRVLQHRSVPPGDGGLALGQAVVAAERLRWTAPGTGPRTAPEAPGRRTRCAWECRERS